MKTHKKVEATKEKIKTALLILLKQTHLDKIKVSDLCNLANINRGTFYLHYETVEEVLIEIYEQVVLDIRSIYNFPTYSSQNFYYQNSKETHLKLFNHIQKFQNFYEIVLSNKVNSSFYYTFFDLLRNNMRANLVYHNNLEEDMEYFIGFYVNATIGIILCWYERGFKETPEEMNHILLSIFNTALNQKDI